MSVPRNHGEGAAKIAHGNALLDEVRRGKSRASKPVNVDAEYAAKARGQRDIKPNAFDRGITRTT